MTDEEDPMTITASDMVTDPAAAAGEMPADDEVLTVDQFPSHLGPDVSTEDTITTSVEAAFLTALMWAPKDLAQQVRQVMTGPDRWNPFWSPAHAEIFDAVSSVLDEGTEADLRQVENDVRYILQDTRNSSKFMIDTFDLDGRDGVAFE